MRIIPKQTKVSIEFFKGVDLFDVIVGTAGGVLTILAFTSNLPGKMGIAIVMLLITIVLVAPIDDIKGYSFALQVIKYLARPRIFVKSIIGNSDDAPVLLENKKKRGGASEKSGKKDKAKAAKKDGKRKQDGLYSDVKDITGFTGIRNNAIVYGDYYAKVIEIDSIEFRFFSEHRQNNIIDKVLGGVLRTMTMEQTMSFVKVDRPVIYDNYIESEFDKVDQLKESYLNGLIEEEELYARVEIIFDRIDDIQRLCFTDKIYKPFHYVVIMERNLGMLEEITRSAIEMLTQGDMPVRALNTKELAVFLKYNYKLDFDEREVEMLSAGQYMDWILPDKIQFTTRTVIYDGLVTNNLRVIGYPTVVGNAWGHRMFNLPDTKVVMKFKLMDRNRAIRNIDRSIDELRGQETSTGKTSKLIELSGHIDTLTELLALLQNDNEALFDVTIMVTVMDYEKTEQLKNPLPKRKLSLRSGKGENADVAEVRREPLVSAKKKIKRILAEDSFRTTEMIMQQFEAYSCSLIGASCPMRKKARSIHSTSLAAAFPFVYSTFEDEGGVNIGDSSGVPMFINFFKRDRDRVNSNMVIIGKSGSGKSYATKTILTHLAAEDSKVFVLDPENEYGALAKSLKGKIIDVGTATQGRLNPFHVITSLSDEEGNEDEQSMGFSAHLQFLEEFFKQILPGIASEPLEFLNNMILRMYEDKGIDSYSEFASLAPEDFPIFDDLYDRVLTENQRFTSEYNKNLLRTLINYISKFSTGGRNANLWNGPASISTKENFIVFNFQSLLANKNNTIANAQMLLVLKWLDNEIIKNRDYNMKYNASRKIIVVIDEAHVFIDEKFPIALDFMHQLAKRIRKYNGMQIVITQNVKDFVCTDELARKSAAIINACQYSFIFPLAPNDMHDLCTLYEKAGAINETEQEEIINNGRGRAFVITSPSSRTSADIIATEAMQRMFQG